MHKAIRIDYEYVILSRNLISLGEAEFSDNREHRYWQYYSAYFFKYKIVLCPRSRSFEKNLLSSLNIFLTQGEVVCVIEFKTLSPNL